MSEAPQQWSPPPPHQPPIAPAYASPPPPPQPAPKSHTARRVAWVVLIVLLLGGGGLIYQLASKAGFAPAGAVTFGTDLDMTTLALSGERSSFATTDKWAWRAALSGPADTTSLTIVLAKKNGSAEVMVLSQPMTISNPSFNIVGSASGSLVGVAPGDYVLRVLRGNTSLAEGSFRVAP